MTSVYNMLIDNVSPLSLFRGQALSITGANSSIVLPANAYILGIQVENLTANAVTGGLKIGTTAGGVDVVAALTVGASAKTFVLDAALLLRFFSSTAPQTIYLDAVTAWNSAKLNVRVIYTVLA